MRVLKFLQDTEPPETIVCDETIGFGDLLIVSETSVFFYDTIGFSDKIPQGINEIVYETIGFGDLYITSTDILLYETIGFHDSSDESLKVLCIESIAFNDSIEQDLTLDITCTESIGFGIGGFHEMYIEHDIIFSWRTRTKDNIYGYGRSEYGSNTSYGDGDADGLATFEVHVWKLGGPESNRWLNSNPAGEYDDRYHKEVINIVDTGDPDANATYTLTIANNKSYSGGIFISDFEVEVFVKNSDGVYSYPKIIITDTLKVPHEE